MSPSSRLADAVRPTTFRRGVLPARMLANDAQQARIVERRRRCNRGSNAKAGGYGVFDPGINALSMLTEILAAEVLVSSARLKFPANRQAPIAVDMHLRTEDGVPIDAEFDFRHTGEQTWDIDFSTDQGTLKLSMGGSRFSIDGAAQEPADLRGEYARLYERFAGLCTANKSEVDWRPFQLVADAFLIGERETAEPFLD